MANPPTGGSPFDFQANPNAVEGVDFVDGYNTIRALRIMNGPLVDFFALEKELRNLLRCPNYFPCLHAGKLGGKTRVDLQLTVADSDPIDSPDLNAGTGIDISVSDSDITIAVNAELAAVAGLSGTGIIVRTGSATYALRTITSTGSTVTITNPGGVAGNINLEVSGSGVDHGTLTGLSDDDHTQYMLDAGASTAGNLPSFTNTDGRTMQDSGVAAASIVIGPASAIDDRIATFDGTTGKLIQDGGSKISDLVPALSILRAVSGSNETVNNSTTLSTSANLVVSVEASATYIVDIVVLGVVVNGDTGGIKLALGGTATLTSARLQIVIQEGSANTEIARGQVTALGSSVGGLTTVAAALIYATIRGSIVVNGAGSFAVQWAQQAESGAGEATTLRANSNILLTKV